MAARDHSRKTRPAARRAKTPEPRGRRRSDLHPHSAAASETIEQLATGDEDAIPVGSVARAVGSRVHGLALLLFAIPEALPLPIPSVSGIIGLPLVLISAHLLISGDSARLPKRIEAARLPRKAIAAVARYLVPVLRRLERLSRPRWAALLRRERLIGAVCLYLSVILFLPIPLINAPCAICLVAIGLGMMQRDGMLVATGFAGAVLTTAALIGLIDVAGKAIGHLGF